MSRAERVLGRREARHRQRCRWQAEDPKADLKEAFARRLGLAPRPEEPSAYAVYVGTQPGYQLHRIAVPSPIYTYTTFTPMTLTGAFTLSDPWPIWTGSTIQQVFWATWNQTGTSADVRAEQHQLAQARARSLLDSLLTAEQRSDLDTLGRFYVRSSRGRRFCIRAAGQAGNVDWVDDAGVALGTFCCHPNGVPDPDGWIAQMLQLIHDEDGFLRVANLSRGLRPEAAPAPAPPLTIAA